MGDPPPTKYQPNSGQRSCGVVGLSSLTSENRKSIINLVEKRGYRVVQLEQLHSQNPLTFEQDENLAVLDLTLRNADARSSKTRYWEGAISAAAVPSIAFTCNPNYPFNQDFPLEFQPRPANQASTTPLIQVLAEEFNLYEQNFLSAQDPETIDRYVKTQIQAGSLAGNYEASTRQLFIGAIMGDQYNVSGQTGAVGSQAHAHDITFNQTWDLLQNTVDLPGLADELVKLRRAMERDAVIPEHMLAVGSVAAAEMSTRQNNGPKTIEYLKSTGKWALGIAEKTGLDLAKEAIKVAIDL